MGNSRGLPSVETRPRRVALLRLAVSLALVSAWPGSAALADDGAVLGPEKGAVETGFFVGALFPASDQEFYDPHVTRQKELESVVPMIGVRLGYFPLEMLGVEVEGLIAPAKTADSGGDAPIYGVRGQLIGQYPGRITPFAVAGMGVSRVSSSNSVLGRDTDRLAHLGLGAKFYATESMSVRLDLRYLRGPAADKDTGTNHYEILLGLAWTPFESGPSAPAPEPDPDGDGFTGDADRCPTTPGVAPDGCPAPVDTDGDGILDSDDECPEQAETVNEYQDEDGCPDEVPDTDGDGIDDRKDGCVEQAEDKDGFEDEDGCPDLDNDGDGVTDAADQCPLEAGPAENRGCPDTDRDGDGVADRVDNCPDEPGTADNHGCKEEQLVVLSQTHLKILDKVFFATGQAVVQRRSRKLLDNVARVLLAHPEIKKIRVEGHTDNVGKPEANKVLSQKRADAVVEYLVEKGVPAERLEPVGFGEDEPVDTNDTREGRANNRRVEFEISERQDANPAPESQPS